MTELKIVIGPWLKQKYNCLAFRSFRVLAGWALLAKLAITLHHRRRIELEDKAKVVASVWRTNFVQFLAAVAVMPW